MGDHADAAGLTYVADHFGQIAAVAWDPAGPPPTQIAIERLVPIAYDTEPDERISDVGPAHRRGRGRDPGDVVHRDVDADVAQSGEHGGQPVGAAVADRVELGGERWIGGVEQIGQQVDTGPAVPARELHARYQA